MPPRKSLIAAAAAAAALAVAAPASADSISYVRDGNVFLTTPDGSRTVQVTTAGGYASASQADDGRILALKGNRFQLMNRWGDVLSDFSPVASGTAGTVTLTGPFDPAISPDGTRVAYGMYVQYRSGDPDCGRPGGCEVGHLYAGTGYSRADGPADWHEPGFLPQYGWMDPSWIDNGSTLLAATSSGFLTESAVDTAGDGKDALQWFSDHSEGVQNLFDGEMNRQKSAVAFVANTTGDHLRVYRMPEAPAENRPPEGCLDAPAQGGAWSSPSWAPSGEQLVATAPRGLYVASLPGIGAGCPDAGSVKVALIDAPGAKSADWGPADLPGPKPEAPHGGGDAPRGGGGPSASTRLTLAAAHPALGRAVRRGLRVRVSCSAGRVKVTAARAGRTVARGSAACRGGTATVRVRFTRSARRGLRHAAKVRLALRAISAEGTGTAKLTLRR
jgi:hypothetical protein